MGNILKFMIFNYCMIMIIKDFKNCNFGSVFYNIPVHVCVVCTILVYTDSSSGVGILG